MRYIATALSVIMPSSMQARRHRHMRSYSSAISAMVFTLRPPSGQNKKPTLQHPHGNVTQSARTSMGSGSRRQNRRWTLVCTFHTTAGNAAVWFHQERPGLSLCVRIAGTRSLFSDSYCTLVLASCLCAKSVFYAPVHYIYMGFEKKIKAILFSFVGSGDIAAASGPAAGISDTHIRPTRSAR